MQRRSAVNQWANASVDWAVTHAVYYPPTPESITALGPLYRSTEECVHKALVILAGMALQNDSAANDTVEAIAVGGE